MAAIQTTAGSIGPGQTVLSTSGRSATSAGGTTAVPLGIVPSGKTFFLSDVVLSTIANSEVDTIVQYTLGGVTIPVFRASITATSPCSATGIESQPPVPAGASLTLLLPEVSGAPSVDFLVAGYVQTIST